MHRPSFASGQVAVALVKALMLRLDLAAGPVVTDGWLKRVGLSRDALEDETEMMPVAALAQALAAFAELEGSGAIVAVWAQLVAPDNLGFWMRVLRGTTTPIQAFARLDASESAYGRMTRWETLATGRGYWKGRVHILHDPSLERGGLLALIRAAQLRAVPALFGLGPGTVTATSAIAAESSMLWQDYEVRWRRDRVVALTALGGLVGAAFGVCSLLVGAAPLLACSTGGLGALICSALALSLSRESGRRADLVAQQVRVHALERSLSLKDSRDRVVTTRIEGRVVAGKYRIVSRMGSGASGVIYEAQRSSDGHPVALKLLRAANADDPVASDRLRRESEALGLSWHTNVVEMLDHGHLADGTAYLVMELLRGETLSTRLQRVGKLDALETFSYGQQVCAALVAVHAAGVFHRDIKPSNLFIAQQPDGTERIKLIDFGIARIEWEETRITGPGTPLGTPGYMSPEQEMGAEVDARSDLFALGATLFECLSGEPPPPTPSGRYRSSGAPFDAVPAALRHSIPHGCQSLIERAVAREPEARYPDARAFSAALREAVGNLVASAKSSA